MYTQRQLKPLVTYAEYLKLSPCDQGYVTYMQAEWPGSELKNHQTNPYEETSLNYAAWNRGQRIAVLEIQDNED